MKGNESMLSEIKPSQEDLQKDIIKGEQSIVIEDQKVEEKSVRSSMTKGKLSIRTNQDYVE